MKKLKPQIRRQSQEVVKQIKSNKRLRVSLWVILFIVVCYPILVISDYNQSMRDKVAQELEKEARILRTASEKQWFQRAEELDKLSDRVDSALWKAPSKGIAKATLFQALTSWAENNALDNVQIRLEEPFLVEAQPNIYRVSGQIDVAFDAINNIAFVYDIETNEEKVVIERMNISQRGRASQRLVIAAYFKVES
ncbi:hypothetical protein [Alteromonas oceanisediminis]|uniref:hypothetical protein n=1 Tax=Alteromonas oceanisediminis TaxID=2836180 RepID=UPI001BD95D00|nr:hypothetical protein [Alteromonas oceanisediminis]MBT0585051.1 hypothetical protein [Alteromonas oceanisediminis]